MKDQPKIYDKENLPLTTENLSNLNDGLNTISKMILERYCQEIHSGSSHEKQLSTDSVLKLSKSLHFPYHNDSLFLPTAEQLDYSSSIHSTRTESTFLSRQQSANVQKNHSAFSSLSRSSSSSSINNNIPDKRSLRMQYSNTLKSRGSIPCTRPTRSSTLSSSIIYKESTTDKKKPWLKRILKFLCKNKSKNRNKQQPTSENDQVWFRQYSKNPSFINNQSITA